MIRLIVGLVLILSCGSSVAQVSPNSDDEFGVSLVYDDEAPSPAAAQVPSPQPLVSPVPSRNQQSGSGSLLKGGVLQKAAISPITLRPGPSVAAQAFVPNKLVTISPPASKLYIAKKKCLVFTEPSTKSKPVSYVETGTRLACTEFANGWCVMTRKDKKLFLSKDCF